MAVLSSKGLLSGSADELGAAGGVRRYSTPPVTKPATAIAPSGIASELTSGRCTTATSTNTRPSMMVEASTIASAAPGTMLGSFLARPANDSVTAVDDTSPPAMAVTTRPRPWPRIRLAT